MIIVVTARLGRLAEVNGVYGGVYDTQHAAEVVLIGESLDRLSVASCEAGIQWVPDHWVPTTPREVALVSDATLVRGLNLRVALHSWSEAAMINGAYVPTELEYLSRVKTRWGTDSDELEALIGEATHRADWRHHHCPRQYGVGIFAGRGMGWASGPPPARPDRRVDGALVWKTSVSVVLLSEEGGWSVGVDGAHELRTEALLRDLTVPARPSGYSAAL